KKLVKIWTQILGMPENEIGIDMDFFQLGGHSLKATILIAHVHKEFKVEIPLATIFKRTTVRKIAEQIAGSKQTRFNEIPRTQPMESYPLSYNQLRLLILQKLAPDSPAFNMTGSIDLPHAAGERAVKQALEKIISRHESFRTYIDTRNKQHCQVILEEVEIPLEIIDISKLTPEEKQQALKKHTREITQAFDLTRAPLLKTKLVKMETEYSIFMFMMHHIISDGWSMQVFKKEFLQYYEGARTGQEYAPASLDIQYKDFAVWHNEQLKGPESETNFRYWEKRLAAGIPELHLPADNQCTDTEIEGAGYSITVPGPLKEKLKKQAEKHNTTLFTMMFSIYLHLLCRYSQSEEIACSIIAAGRTHPALHQLIGFFVNPLIFNTKIDKNEPFNRILERVHEDVMNIFSRQDYPLEAVFERMGKRYPKIPVSFNMLNLSDTITEGPGVTPEKQHSEQSQDMKFDLEVYLAEYTNKIGIYWTYKKKMFEPQTIEFIARQYMEMLEYFAGNPDASRQDFKTAKNKKKKKSFKYRQLS
ncbi:MAG: hypothetical protein GY757_51980, partial [bacterium]|nr:hypothetical protein [bacterium]